MATNNLRLSDVCKMTSLSKATIFRLRKNGQFPDPIRLSPNRVAWRENDVELWLNSRPTSDSAEVGNEPA